MIKPFWDQSNLENNTWLLVLWTCWFLDSPNHHPASSSLRSTYSISRRGLCLSGLQWPRRSGFTSGRSGVPSRSHIVHEGLHPFELGGQLYETLLQGVKLLVEISQGVWQGLDPEGQSSERKHTLLTRWTKNSFDLAGCVFPWHIKLPSIVWQHSAVVMQQQIFDLRYDGIFPVV